VSEKTWPFVGDGAATKLEADDRLAWSFVIELEISVESLVLFPARL
jgi:hypothetical protein